MDTTKITDKELEEYRDSIKAMEEAMEQIGWDQSPLLLVAFGADNTDPMAGVVPLPTKEGMHPFEFVALLANDTLPMNPLGMYAAVAPIPLQGVGLVSEAWGIQGEGLPKEEWEALVARAHEVGIQNMPEKVEQRVIMLALQDGTYFSGYRMRGGEFNLKHSTEIEETDDGELRPSQAEGHMDLLGSLQKCIEVAQDFRVKMRSEFEQG